MVPSFICVIVFESKIKAELLYKSHGHKLECKESICIIIILFFNRKAFTIFTFGEESF